MRTGTFLRPGRHECSALSTGLDAATVPTLEPRQRTMSISEAAKNGFVQTFFFLGYFASRTYYTVRDDRDSVLVTACYFRFWLQAAGMWQVSKLKKCRTL